MSGNSLTNDKYQYDHINNGVRHGLDEALACDVEPRTSGSLAGRRRKHEAQEEDVGAGVGDELHVGTLHLPADLDRECHGRLL